MISIANAKLWRGSVARRRWQGGSDGLSAWTVPSARSRRSGRISGRRNYSARWISGADSLRTSNVSDHAHSDQFTSGVTILSSISTCNSKRVTGVVPWIRINGRSISKNWPCKIQFDWPLGQSNLLAYIVHWKCIPELRTRTSFNEAKI